MDFLLLSEKTQLIGKAKSEIVRKVQSSVAGGAGPSSKYSIFSGDLSPEVIGVSVRNLSATEAIGLILTVAAKPTSEAWSFLIWEALMEKTRRHQYQGKWMIVHHLLKVRSNLEFILIELLDSKISLSSVFGNYLELGLSALRSKIKVLTLSDSNQKVKYPQRKRGYNDKGSCRPAHRWLPNKVHLGPNPRKLDFQGLYRESALVNFLYS